MLGMSEEGRGMNQIVLLLPLLLVIPPTGAYATNEGSYKEGYSATFNAYKFTVTEGCDMPT